MAWILVPCLVALREEFNRLAPSRDRASDGSIGDGEHSQSSSDHNPDETGVTPSEDADSRNEVHAIDVDKDLRRSGWTMQRAVDVIVDRHRRGLDDRLQNVIYNRRIWSRSWGWTAREYAGKNPHDKHAHFSARYTTAEENDTRPWGLGGFLMGIFDNEAEYKAYHESLQAPTTKAVRTLLTSEPGLVSSPLASLLASNTDLLGDAFRDLLWDAVHAKRTEVVAADGTTTYEAGKDDVYDRASADRKKEMRNTLQLLQELGMASKGAPVPQG